MFSLTRKAFRFLTSTYTLKKNVATLDSGGEWSTETVSTTTIKANIQNKSDGAEIQVGRTGALVYKTIIILTKNRIGLGDPVYPEDVLTPNVEYIVSAYGEDYRIMLEGGVQKDSDTTSMGGHVFYRYYGELLRN